MQKIKVAGTVVGMDGDGMTRIIGQALPSARRMP